MQLGFSMPIGEQVELGSSATVREIHPPSVRPTADAELEATFLRAALAWARWREQRRWVGR